MKIKEAKIFRADFIGEYIEMLNTFLKFVSMAWG